MKNICVIAVNVVACVAVLPVLIAVGLMIRPRRTINWLRHVWTKTCYIIKEEV